MARSTRSTGWGQAPGILQHPILPFFRLVGPHCITTSARFSRALSLYFSTLKPTREHAKTTANASGALVCNWWTSHWLAASPAEVNYLIFVSVWTILALAYLIVAPARFPAAAHKFLILIVEALTMIFWFAGFIALAVWLTNRVCFGSVCASARAATVFSAFEW